MAEGYRTKDAVMWSGHLITDDQEIQSLRDAGFPLKEVSATQQPDGSWNPELPKAADLPPAEEPQADPGSVRPVGESPSSSGSGATGASGTEQPETSAGAESRSGRQQKK